jgi:dTDP-4-amino-4,6-dideoxygalactose transaminase
MELFINLPLVNRIAMGISAREHIINNYDRKHVINQYLEIHDCSQAHGTFNSGVHVGKGHLSTYSFYPGKNLGAFGDAGMITTDSHDEYQLSKAYRNQGTFSDRYLHEILGFNSRMDTIQAEILRIKLLKL